MKYNSNEIQAVLPHRYPFLLVDKVIDGEEGRWAKGIKCVSANEQFFCGHFPAEHVMPGVLIIEALAQVGAIALLSQEEHRGRLVFFGGIKNAKFRGTVKPGDVLELFCELVRRRGNIGVGNALATVNGTVVCEAEILFAIQNEQKA